MHRLISSSLTIRSQSALLIKRTTLKSTVATSDCISTVARDVVARSFGSSCSASTILSASFVARTPSTILAKPIKFSGLVVRSYSSGNLPPHTVINMPALSPTMTQGNIGQFQKTVGDEMTPGDVLLEIETDKAQMDFECQEEGYIAKFLIEPGTKDVPVNTPIAILVENKEDIPAFENYKPNSASASKPSAAAPAVPKAPETASPITTAPTFTTGAAPPTTQATSGRVFATPVAKTIASEKNFSLSQVPGTGPDGLIIKADVTNFKPTTSPASKPAAAQTTPVAAPAAAYKDIPLSNIRKVIANRLLESKVTIPHYYLTLEINAEKILKLREILNKDSNGKYKLSVNDFIVKATSLALRDVPEVNSAWHDSFIREYKNADIAVAVATPSGLITPIVKSADIKGLEGISSQVKEMAGRAKEGKLQPHEYQGGTFTISNLGMFGISHFTAIINPPHAGILAVGATTSKLAPDESSEKGFSVQQTLNVTLSLDHRVVDGAVGAKWLDRFKMYMENPLKMLL